MNCGIGFDIQTGKISSNRVFQLHGSQAWGIRDFNTYTPDGWMRFDIPIGTYYKQLRLHRVHER